MVRFDESSFTVVASALGYPEGPVWRPDGSVLVCEVKAGTLTRVAPEGTTEVVATPRLSTSAASSPTAPTWLALP